MDDVAVQFPAIGGVLALPFRLIFFALRFSFSVRPGFLAAGLRGDLSDTL
jgi:hypothetical protein